MAELRNIVDATVTQRRARSAFWMVGGMRTSVMDEACAREFADSIEVEEMELPALSPEQVGQALCWEQSDGYLFRAVVKSGLTAELAQAFDGWARQRAFMIAFTGGLDADGWFKRSSDGGWQMTARAVDLPNMDFLSE